MAGFMRERELKERRKLIRRSSPWQLIQMAFIDTFAPPVMLKEFSVGQLYATMISTNAEESKKKASVVLGKTFLYFFGIRHTKESIALEGGNVPLSYNDPIRISVRFIASILRIPEFIFRSLHNIVEYSFYLATIDDLGQPAGYTKLAQNYYNDDKWKVSFVEFLKKLVLTLPMLVASVAMLALTTLMVTTWIVSWHARLIVNYSKTCKEADLLDPIAGAAVRIYGAALIVGLCVVFPPLIVKAIPALAPVVLSVVSGLGHALGISKALPALGLNTVLETICFVAGGIGMAITGTLSIPPVKRNYNYFMSEYVDRPLGKVFGFTAIKNFLTGKEKSHSVVAGEEQNRDSSSILVDSDVRDSVSKSVSSDRDSDFSEIDSEIDAVRDDFYSSFNEFSDDRNSEVLANVIGADTAKISAQLGSPEVRTPSFDVLSDSVTTGESPEPSDGSPEPSDGSLQPPPSVKTGSPVETVPNLVGKDKLLGGKQQRQQQNYVEPLTNNPIKDEALTLGR